MKKQQIELIVIGVGGVLFIALLVNTIARVKGRARGGSAHPPEVEQELVTTAVPEVPDAEARDQSWGRDPFVLKKVEEALPEEKKAAVDLTLNGIIWDKAMPYAVINDEVVAVGDVIGGVTIVEIKKNSVVVDDGTKRFTLNIWEE